MVKGSSGRTFPWWGREGPRRKRRPGAELVAGGCRVNSWHLAAAGLYVPHVGRACLQLLGRVISQTGTEFLGTSTQVFCRQEKSL